MFKVRVSCLSVVSSEDLTADKTRSLVHGTLARVTRPTLPVSEMRQSGQMQPMRLGLTSKSISLVPPASTTRTLISSLSASSSMTFRIQIANSDWYHQIWVKMIESI